MDEPKTFCVEVRSDPAGAVSLYVSVEGQDGVYGPLSMADLSTAMQKLAHGITP